MTLTDASRILYGSPLAKPRFAKLAIALLSVLVLVSGYNVFTLLQQDITTPEGLQVLVIAFLWSALFSLGTVAILWFLDRREHESRWLYLIAFLWGAFIATGISLPLNSAIISAVGSWLDANPDLKAYLGTNAAFAVGAPIAGPLVEESTKGAGLVLLFVLLRSEFDDARDGFIYGALVGAGFNFLESVIYIANEYARWGYAPWIVHIAGRHALFGFTIHALFTGLFGLFLGLSRQTTRNWWRYTAPVVGWLLGYIAHFLQDAPMLFSVLAKRATGEAVESIETPLPSLDLLGMNFLQVWLVFSGINVLKVLPFLLLVVILLWRGGVWERRVIREGLAEEGEPVITPEEYDAVKRDRILKTRRIHGYSRRISAAIVKAQDELAFRKWRIRQMGEAVDTDPLVADWREAIVRLRGRALPSALVV